LKSVFNYINSIILNYHISEYILKMTGLEILKTAGYLILMILKKGE